MKMGAVDADIAMPPVSAPPVPQQANDLANGYIGGGGVHTPEDPEAHYTEDHRKERAERQSRREALSQSRRRLDDLPVNHFWEVPGR